MRGPQKSYRQTDFSGGLFEATSAGDFTDRQLSRCYGMVLEGEVSVRSQPPVQVVGRTGTGFTQLRTFQGRQHNWLLAMKADGSVWWTPAPSDDESSAKVSTYTWMPVAGAPADPAQRFLCEVPAGSDDTSYRGAWLINGLASSHPAFVVGENPSGTGVVVLTSWADRYASTTVTTAGDYVPDVNVMPHADLGVMWGDYLVLGRIRWYTNSAARAHALDAAHTKPYTGAIWVSATPAKVAGPHGKYQEFRIDQWNPLSVFSSMVPPEAELLDMRVIDAGLLLLHTQGATLVRGTPPDAMRPDAITAIGGARWDGAAGNPRSTFWAETGTTVWVEQRGSVWQTNGADVAQLDQHLHLGENAAASASDQVCAVGPWLLLSRAGRLLCMRRFATDAAWTELNAGGTATDLCALGFSLYYLVDGVAHRLPFTASTERGRIDGELFDIVVATPTLGDPESWDRKLWHRAGVVASAGSFGQDRTRPAGWWSTRTPEETVARVESVAVRAGASLATPAAEAYRNEVATDITGRAEVVVPAGVGATMEAALEVTFRGDVRLEALFADVRGSHRSAR